MSMLYHEGVRSYIPAVNYDPQPGLPLIQGQPDGSIVVYPYAYFGPTYDGPAFDDAGTINYALQQAQNPVAGNNPPAASTGPSRMVRLMGLTYNLYSPVVFPYGQNAGVTLAGLRGCTTSADDSAPRLGTVLYARSSWANAATLAPYVTAMVVMIEQTPGGASVLTRGHRMRDLWVDGSALPGPAGAVDGIAMYGGVQAVDFEGVAVINCTGHGFAGYNDPASTLVSPFPDGINWLRCIANSNGGDGWHGKFDDSAIINCYAHKSGGDGYYITGYCRLIGCRADQNTNGITTDSLPGGGNYATIVISGCGVNGNSNAGFNVYNSSPTGTAQRSPVLITGCNAQGDGLNGVTPGFGILVSGKNIVTIDNTQVTVSTAVISPGGCPAYGLGTATIGSTPGHPISVRMLSGLLNYATAADNANAGNATDYLVSPNVGIAAGYEPASVTSY